MRTEKIILPEFFGLEMYISDNFDFVNPLDKNSITRFIEQQIEYFEKKGRWLSLYKVTNVEYVKTLVEKVNSIRRGYYVPESLVEPSYELFERERGEYFIKEVEDLYKNTSQQNSHSVDDTDIIKIIGQGGGDAHGYGD